MHLGIRDHLPDRLSLFILQGATAAALGFAAGSALRARGHAEPGQWIASFVAVALVAQTLWSDARSS